jgi:hypothetical protein
MKKIIIRIAAVLLLAFGNLHAQELKFDGYINSGLGLVSDDQPGSDARIKAFAVDSGQNGYRFRLNGAYTNAAGSAGARFRFQSQTSLTSSSGSVSVPIDIPIGTDVETDGYSAKAAASVSSSTTTEFISFPYLYGWVGFLENKINISGGILEESAWATGDFWINADSLQAYSGLGALLKLAPVEGLVFGFGAQTVGRRSGPNNNTLAKSALGAPVVLEDARYTAHLLYALKDAFRFSFSYRTESKIGFDETSKIIASFRYLGDKNLTAIVATNINNLGKDFDTTGETILSETFAYKIDDFDIGLNAVQFLWNRKTNNETGLLFNLWASYTIGIVVPRLDLVYFAGGSSRFVPTPTSAELWWHRTGFYYSGAEGQSVFSARPSVKINLDNRTHLEIGDMLNVDSQKTGDPVITNVFYADLKWSF